MALARDMIEKIVVTRQQLEIYYCFHFPQNLDIICH